MPEIPSNKPLDTVVALGHNLGPFWSKERIINTPDHLSLESRMIADSAAYLYLTGKVKSIIFSTGHTSGKYIPAEASAMAVRVNNKFPHLPASALILETNSLDTLGNVLESGKIIKERNFNTVGILSTNGHAQNAYKLFKRYAINAKFKILLAEDILHKKISETSRLKAQQFLQLYKEYEHLSGNKIFEFLREFLLETFDPKGRMLHFLAAKSRREKY